MPDQGKGKQRDRLSNALRENLKRRKAQAKGRAKASLADDGQSQDRSDDEATDSAAGPDRAKPR